jgi:glycosyltransferase involved in cell wall biosynthesis
MIVKSLTYLIMFFQTSFHLFLDAYFRHPEQIVIQRTILPRYMPLFVTFLLRKVTNKAKLIWDFDDDLFETHEISTVEKDILIKKASRIIVINDRLKSLLPQEVHYKVELLPTTDGDMQSEDRAQILQQRENSFKKEIKLVWVATPSNIRNINYILPTLDKAALKLQKKQKKLRMIIVCSIPIEYKAQFLIIDNRKWTRQVAIDAMKEAHIGIMPLLYGKHALGKGAFKAVQYLSIGLPVMASKVGFNTEVVNEDCGILVDDIKTPDNWCPSLLHFIEDDNLNKKSKLAYKRWEKNFSYNYNYQRWLSFLS